MHLGFLLFPLLPPPTTPAPGNVDGYCSGISRCPACGAQCAFFSPIVFQIGGAKDTVAEQAAILVQ